MPLLYYHYYQLQLKINIIFFSPMKLKPFSFFIRIFKNIILSGTSIYQTNNISRGILYKFKDITTYLLPSQLMERTSCLDTHEVLKPRVTVVN